MGLFGEFDGLLEEIILYEILPRLPLKSLIRFKLVSTLWNNFITHNNFLLARNHHCNSRNLSNSTFFFNNAERVISTRDDHNHHFKLSNPEFVNQFLFVRGSINGLFYGYCKSPYLNIFICNPITKHVVYVPNPKHLIYFALAVDTHNTPQFGFLVVGIHINDGRYNINSNWLNFEVYSSKAKRWRLVSNAKLQVPDQKLPRFADPIFVGKKVYWSLVTHLLWFDVEKDVSGLIQCPDTDNLVFQSPKRYISYMEFGVCSNSVISYSKMTKTGGIEVWLLKSKKEDHEEFKWVKKCNLSLQLIFRQNWNIVSRFCRMIIRTPKKVGKILAKRGYILPLPYQGGELVWFILDLWSREGHRRKPHQKLFSINMITRELKLYDGDFPLPSIRFSATLLPCPT
ncbi:hypothetical protein Scep_025537 [Stephania cephalantha]|uniref:F-box domain-containing protein n=1 Tax=Stephania cephalantha TaxID=152367 RepID=A0AAP0EP04_9MAGN